MKEILASLSVVVSLLFIFGLIITVVITNYNYDEDKYNGGICTVCEGHYHFIAANHGYYYYQCDKCENVIELRHLIEKN